MSFMEKARANPKAKQKAKVKASQVLKVVKVAKVVVRQNVGGIMQATPMARQVGKDRKEDALLAAALTMQKIVQKVKAREKERTIISPMQMQCYLSHRCILPMSMVINIQAHRLLHPLEHHHSTCLLYTSPSPRDGLLSRMPSSA